MIKTMIKRRDFLKGVGAGVVVSASGGLIPRFALSDPTSMGPAELPSGTLESAVLEAMSGKKPLIKRTFRPPNFETPVTYFNELFTPNDVFFVRYHLINIPKVNEQDWKLRIGGEAVQKPLEFTMDELKRSFEQVEIVAVNQCSGNRRGLVQPHVPGIQWGYGAMGNGQWRGVRLKEVLNKAGIKKDALEVVVNGADSGAIAGTPDFVKSLPMWKALDEHTLIAFEMNGEPLPHWNGYPARLVVPGWTATYWVKQLSSIDVVFKPFDGFWMKTAYRVPKGVFPMVDRFVSQEAEVNTPITEMMVNSLITYIEDGQRFSLGQWIKVKGIAWDGGYGIQRVEVSTEEGKFWRLAELGKDYGRFSWRQWSFQFKPHKKGTHSIMVKVINRIGGTQTFQLIQNPAGYHHNLVQKLNILVA
jgi:Sulfite oxidase and related enzymes